MEPKVTDYHDFCTKATPEAERRRLNTGDIWNNQVRCLKCNDTPRSRNRHDMVSCKCGSVSVDGGSWYLKRNFKERDSFEELSTLFDDAKGEYE
jgi:hypothetical protein